MGTFTLRLPPTLHTCVRKLAKKEDRSLQMWIQRKLEAALPEGMIAAEAIIELRAKKAAKRGEKS